MKARKGTSQSPGSLRLFINGRFLTQDVTGVQRVGIEFVNALDTLLAEGEFPGSRSPSLRLPRQPWSPLRDFGEYVFYMPGGCQVTFGNNWSFPGFLEAGTCSA